jgi:hypothetical protein
LYNSEGELKVISNKKQEYIGIDVVIRNVEDIYKHYDYISLNGKNLNYELEEYIFKALKNYPLSQKVKLIVRIPEGSEEYESGVLMKSIQEHFTCKVKEVDIFIKQQFKQWRINMVIGTLFLILCLILVEIFDEFSYINVMRIIKESFLIVGWVALWDPLTFILFGYQNIIRDKKYYIKLCALPITIERYYTRNSRIRSMVKSQ